MKRTKQIGLYLSDEERDMLDRLCAVSGTPYSIVIRQLIREAVKKLEGGKK